MYASLRVHQLRDYARRDDVWGLMYVFCDIVSGGLPWMDHARSKERDKCQMMKEWIHGERSDPYEKDDEYERYLHIEELLKGGEYYKCKYRRYREKKRVERDGPSSVPKFTSLPEPLAMSKDKVKIQALIDAFNHLAGLNYTDEPDYDLIERCLNQFIAPTDDGHCENGKVQKTESLINWQQPSIEEVYQRRLERKVEVKEEDSISGDHNYNKGNTPHITFEDKSGFDYKDPLEEDTLIDAEREIQDRNGMQSSSVNYVMRLPLNLQFRLAQVEYNALHRDTIPCHLAFRDWMALAMDLVYKPWDERNERPNDQKNGNLYQRESYIKIIEQCLKGGEVFNMFQTRDCFYDNVDEKNPKRRKMSLGHVFDKGDLMGLSRVIVELRSKLSVEQSRAVAPPPDIAWR